MMYIYFRHLKKRQKFSRRELMNRLLKAVCVNENIDYKTRQRIFDHSNKRMAKGSYAKISKGCNFTNRGASVSKFYKVGRIPLRNMLSAGLIYGMTKSAF